MTDLSHFALDLALETKAFITTYVTKALVGITDRFTALEEQLAAVKALVAPGPAGERGETGPEGPPGRDGQNADHDAIMAEVTAAIALLRTDVMAAMREDVTKMFSALRMPADGRDGRDADMTAIKALVDASVLTQRQPLPDVEGMVSAAVTKAFAGVTLPRDGVDGKDGAPGTAGRDGVNGLPGKDGASVTLDEVRPFLAAEVDAVVRRTVATLPPAKDGRDGLPGVPGPQGEKGADGRDGLNGKDGAAGLNGKDGTMFDAFDIEFDDQAGVLLRLKQGEQVVDRRIPTTWDAGVWRAGKAYPRGAEVSWNGSLWIAQKDTRGEKPGDGSGVWRLAVKAGRDFKPPRE